MTAAEKTKKRGEKGDVLGLLAGTAQAPMKKQARSQISRVANKIARLKVRRGKLNKELANLNDEIRTAGKLFRDLIDDTTRMVDEMLAGTPADAPDDGERRRPEVILTTNLRRGWRERRRGCDA